jgi:DNA modification methylase
MDGGGVERDDEKNGERSGWKWEEAQHLGFWLVRCARFCSSISCVYFLCSWVVKRLTRQGCFI